jgi:hypothetical protein
VALEVKLEQLLGLVGALRYLDELIIVPAEHEDAALSHRDHVERCAAKSKAGFKRTAQVADPGWMAARHPGQHARAKASRYKRRVLLVLGAITAAIALAATAFGWQDRRLWLAECAGLLAILAVRRLVVPIAERWSRGAAGEETVGAILESLRDDAWLALHDVSLGRGNVDHVIVGPAGLFTIETKSHRGRISVASLDPRWLKQAYAQSKLIERVSGLPVEALLVFSHAYLDRAPHRRRGVMVLPARMLRGHLARRPARLSGAEVERVHAQLCAAVDV